MATNLDETAITAMQLSGSLDSQFANLSITDPQISQEQINKFQNPYNTPSKLNSKYDEKPITAKGAYYVPEDLDAMADVEFVDDLSEKQVA